MCPENSIAEEKTPMGENLEKGKEFAYQEAGHWLRMANVLAWTISTLLVTAMLGTVKLGMDMDEKLPRLILVIGCGLLWLVWCCMMFLYAKSAATAREALRQIEGSWGLHGKGAFYTSQKLLFARPFGPIFIIVVFTIGLIFGWAIILGK